MNPEIEKLVKLAVADGEITETERAVILRKAEKLGEDIDEVELILGGELALQKKKQKQIIKASLIRKESLKNVLRAVPLCRHLVLNVQIVDLNLDNQKQLNR